MSTNHDERETARRARALMGELSGPPIRLPSSREIMQGARRHRIRRWLPLAAVLALVVAGALLAALTLGRGARPPALSTLASSPSGTCHGGSQ